ncbi:MAG: CrcB family protein [Actinomycetota bacterium]|nr:CrcB family protein [Actinomycetota bacterium]
MSLAMLGWVALGASIGAPARFLVDRAVTRASLDSPIPIGLLVVNVLGSALLGVVVGLENSTLLVLLGTGFCGAFTTFSGFAWESTTMWSERRGRFWSFIALMVLACVLAFWITWTVTTHLS